MRLLPCIIMVHMETSRPDARPMAARSAAHGQGRMETSRPDARPRPRGAPRTTAAAWRSRVPTRGQWPREKKGPLLRVCGAGGLEMEVGGALLSRAPGRSIIAAGALNGRVRDGNGCLSPAKATNQRDWAMRTSKMKELHGAFPPRRGTTAAGRKAGKPHGLSERFG